MSVETQNYRYLDVEHIVATIDRLGARISERFPQSGLAAVCSELRDVAASAKNRSIEIGRPMSVLRVSAALFALTVIVAGIASAPRLPIIGGQMDVADFIQSLEATTNIVVLLGAALFFLVSLETRIRRRKALAALHELRSIAHIIDMHQLTKDPERVRPDATFTDASPRPGLTRLQLLRYLDYCSEMLSLTGKLAALYVQRFDDGVAVGSANEVEQLCTGLSRKIWQKINIAEGLPDATATG